MAVLLDSASLEDAATAAELGFVSGITTNPTLMAPGTSPPLAHLHRAAGGLSPPAQALLAHETGCRWVIPYVDRAARQSVGGLVVVNALAAILERLQSGTRILAASLKSAPQV